MRRHLELLEGLDFLDNGNIVAVSRLGEKALKSVAEALAILLEADHLEAASTLIRMCKPSVRLDLLELCKPDHVKKLTASDDTKVREAMDVALRAAARAALTRQPQELAQFFRLLPHCSPLAREHSVALFPPLTTNMLRGLEDLVLVDAVNLTLVQIRKLDTDSCLTELVSLQSIADDLEVSDMPRAAVMKSILWLALDPKRVPDPALSSKLEELQSRVRIPALTPELLNSISAVLRRGVAGVAEMQKEALHNLNESFAPQPGLPSLLDEIDFKAALRAGDLKKAANLIHNSPNEPFCAEASGKLFVAVSLGLKEVGIHVRERKVEFRDAEAAEQQASVAREMAVVLAMTGKPSSTRKAEAILSLLGSGPGALIRGVLEGLGFPDRGDARSQICDALPTLCDAGHSAELNLILRTKLGECLVAQAVDDYLSQSELRDDAVVLLFKTLAHRVDLRTTLLFQSIGPAAVKARHLRIQADQRWASLSKRLMRLEFHEKQSLLNECIQDLGEWKPGWRVLLFPCLDPTFNESDGIFAVLSVKAVDAAAADKRGGVGDGIDLPALNGRLQRTLARMLNTSVAGKPLLSDGARLNVMSTIVSSMDLANRIVAWAKDPDRPVSTGDKVQLYKGMADALINLQHDLSPSRFDATLPANHAVADVAAMLWSVVPPSDRGFFENELKTVEAKIEKRRIEIGTKKDDKVELGFLVASLKADQKRKGALHKNLEMEDLKDDLRRMVANLLVDIERHEPGKVKALMSEEAWAELGRRVKPLGI
ncbi:hypothetical protein H6CHR_02297 [Variovorax sp. PBL-H6]|nr:hypothetical protein H6CHR_02297 [Variovorax sp. PBL-H6]